MTSPQSSADPNRIGDASLLGDEAGRPNPYAVPLATLVTGAFVAVPEQVQSQPVSVWPETVSDFSHGGDGDGDGD